MVSPQQFVHEWSPGGISDGAKESLIDTPDINLSSWHHFATRERANDFVRLMRTLPDPDPVLRKMGKSITALRELLIDSHLESVWSVRCSAASGAQWFIGAGEGGGKQEQEAADSFSEQLKGLDVPRIIEEMMDAMAYGYVPLEILWKLDNGLWGIENIVGKPPQWFEFDLDNRLVFSRGMITEEPVPENRFLLVQHRPTYLNPYGDKAFSKCFWPATFKRKGWQWWTVFVEKYGGAFLYGKYPNNASEEHKAELMDALESMISDACAIAPEGSEITIEALSNKGSVSNLHSEYIHGANAELSKAILGQTLTTELGGKTGSYAAAQAHNVVREDLAQADRRRICAAFNRLTSVYTFYNFGSDVIPPVFTFVKDEDLQGERVDRDTKLYGIGWRPKKSYIVREYGIPEEDFDLTGGSEKEQTFTVMKPVGGVTHHSPDSCGCMERKRRGFFGRLFSRIGSLFSSKGHTKDDRLMQEFETSQVKGGQDEINKIVSGFVDALGTVENYEDALDAVMGVYDTQGVDDLAYHIDEIRYAAQGIGGGHG
jgi:phage gp29-like protein